MIGWMSGSKSASTTVAYHRHEQTITTVLNIKVMKAFSLYSLQVSDCDLKHHTNVLWSR